MAIKIGGVPVDQLRVQTGTDKIDLDRGTKLLELAEPASELLLAITNLPAPDFGTVYSPPIPAWFITASLLLTALVLGAALVATDNNGSASPLGSGTTSSMLSTVSPAPPLAESNRPTLDPNRFREPDRVIEILISERETLIRREPDTQDVIWESARFSDVEILSIDPNTVTIQTRGNRLLVSLADGTLLPP